MLRDATVAALLEALAKNKIPHEVNRAENYLVMGETRSRILFRAVEEFERLRGSNLAWFGLDELTYTSEEAWLRLEGRLREPATPAALIEKGPLDLAKEMLGRIKSECGLSEDQRKN
jgi:hypothetical protein